MSEPYFTAKPGDPLRSKQWNELQIRLRDEIQAHTHTGGDQGTKIAGDGIDPNAAVTVRKLGVTESVSIGNPVQFFVNATGNVGIGTTTPGANRLQVAGALRADTVSADKVTTGVLEGVTSFAVAAFRADTVSTARVTAGVIDGVASLTATAIKTEGLTAGKLTATAADGLTSVALAAGASLTFADNGQIASLDNNHRLLFRRAENVLELRELGSIVLSAGAKSGAATNSVTVTPAGNVGIGTVNPGARLTIQQGPTDRGAIGDNLVLFASGVMGDGQSYNGGVEFRRDTLAHGIGFGYNTIYAAGTAADQTLALISRGAAPLALNHRAGGKVIAGSLGIGVSPNSPLQFDNKLGDKIVVLEGSPTERYGLGVGAGTLSLFVPEGGRMAVCSGKFDGPERLVVTGAGDVAIGASAPESALHVERNVAAGLGAELVLANKAGGTNAAVAISFGTDSSTAAKGGGNAQIVVTNVDGATNRSELAVSTWNGAALGERLRLSGDGAVVTGNLTASGSVAWGNFGSRTMARADAGLQGNAGAQSGCFETNAPVNFPAGANNWWHLLDVRHSNLANNYAMQLAGSFYDQNLWFRKTNGSPTQAWVRLLSTADLAAGLTLGGPLTPKTGNAANAGIQFPTDIGGGGGDQAYIRYYATAGEACRLVVACENDADDALVLRQAGAERVVIANGAVALDPNTSLWVGGKLLASSDERLKQDITPLDGALDKLLRVRGVRFAWNGSSRRSGPEIGVVAQDVAAVFPEMVDADAAGMMGVDYARLVAPLIEAVREQQAQIDELRAELRRRS